mmetsp:Transcript_29527/g.87456  ORF Transcript_29527/g.87456 Transcript_29527/m.87456 type:complete len:436 (-) Transcript_29527:608-1915(-)
MEFRALSAAAVAAVAGSVAITAVAVIPHKQSPRHQPPPIAEIPLVRLPEVGSVKEPPVPSIVVPVGNGLLLLRTSFRQIRERRQCALLPAVRALAISPMPIHPIPPLLAVVRHRRVGPPLLLLPRSSPQSPQSPPPPRGYLPVQTDQIGKIHIVRIHIITGTIGIIQTTSQIGIPHLFVAMRQTETVSQFVTHGILTFFASRISQIEFVHPRDGRYYPVAFEHDLVDARPSRALVIAVAHRQYAPRVFALTRGRAAHPHVQLQRPGRSPLPIFHRGGKIREPFVRQRVDHRQFQSGIVPGGGRAGPFLKRTEIPLASHVTGVLPPFSPIVGEEGGQIVPIDAGDDRSAREEKGEGPYGHGRDAQGEYEFAQDVTGGAPPTSEVATMFVVEIALRGAYGRAGFGVAEGHEFVVGGGTTTTPRAPSGGNARRRLRST